jgi:Regulator of ribonuclease activity B
MPFLDRLRQNRPPPAELDLLLVRRLRSVGADLTRPRPISHFLYFGGEPEARRAAADIEDAGYDVTVEPTEEQWSVRAEGSRVVDETTIVAFRAWFEDLAGRHGGEYDGWESPAEPDRPVRRR